MLQIASDQVHQLNGGVEWYTDFLQANFVDYMNPVMEYMSHSTQYGMVTSSDKFMLKLRQHFEGVVARRISGVVEMYGNDVRRYTRFRAIDVITKLHMASAMLPMEKIIPTEAMLLPEPAMATKVSTQSSVRTQGEYVMPVNSPRQKKVVAERELKKLEAIRSMSTCQCHDPKLFNIGDFVQGGYAQVYPMEWSMIDFDYLRNTAYQYYVRIAMILSELLRATLHSEFLDNLLDTSEKTLMKDILNIESEPLVGICLLCFFCCTSVLASPLWHKRLRIQEEELKEMVPVNPDMLTQKLNDEQNKSQRLGFISHTLGQLRADIRSHVEPRKPIVHSGSMLDNNTSEINDINTTVNTTVTACSSEWCQPGDEDDEDDSVM